MLEWLNRNRRTFLQSILASPLAAAVGTGRLNAAKRGTALGPPREILHELGVRTFLNAAGTYTRLTASTMPPEVLSAMRAVSDQYVDLEELHQKTGDRIASMLECEAALVTAGCASALTLATAACMAGSDEESIRRLPESDGMRNEVVLQKSHRNSYDHAVRSSGAKLVEVESPAELESAIGDRTVMLFFLNRAANDGQIGHEAFVRVGKDRGVPTLIDAAADVPPVDNLFRFQKLGYDLVAFSGGKGLRGPQSAGLLLGRRDLIEAAKLNNSPHSDSVGRSNKVNKEEVVGMLVALDLYLHRDHDRDWRQWTRQCRTIERAVSRLSGVSSEIFVPEISNAVPHLRLSWNYERSGIDPKRAADLLREGDPRVEVRPRFEDGLEIAVWMLEPGQERAVSHAVRKVLST